MCVVYKIVKNACLKHSHYSDIICSVADKVTLADHCIDLYDEIDDIRGMSCVSIDIYTPGRPICIMSCNPARLEKLT